MSTSPTWPGSASRSAVPSAAGGAAAELLAIAVGSTVSDAARDSIVERSAGNPLFVWEFGQLMAQSGRFDVAPAAVPWPWPR